jgi:hypothetical protein
MTSEKSENTCCEKCGESNNHRKILPGIILLSLGIIFLLNNYGYMNFDIGKLWPIFLIIPGLFMILGKTNDR